MKFPTRHRSLTAWTLYASVLLSLLFCGIHHGQMSGLALSGLDSGYCVVEGGDSSALASKTTLPQGGGESAVKFSCPLCSAALLCMVFLIGLTWLLSGRQRQAWTGDLRCKAPPRYSWPSANPRASPF